MEFTIENLYKVGSKSFNGMFWAHRLAQIFGVVEADIVALLERLAAEGYIRKEGAMSGSPVYQSKDGVPELYEGSLYGVVEIDLDNVIKTLDEVTDSLLLAAQRVSNMAKYLRDES